MEWSTEQVNAEFKKKRLHAPRELDLWQMTFRLNQVVLEPQQTVTKNPASVQFNSLSLKYFV